MAKGYEGRTSAFGDGAHGGDMVGAGTHPATSVQQNVSPAFGPMSVLQLPNMIQPVNGMSSSTYDKSLPQQAMLRQTTGNIAAGGNGIQNV